MTQYRIVCTEQVPYGHPPASARIVAVGIGPSPHAASVRWTVEQVLTAMERGDVFYTQGPLSGRVAQVVRYWCPVCSRYHIRSAPDAVQDNNLDALQYCSWRQTA